MKYPVWTCGNWLFDRLFKIGNRLFYFVGSQNAIKNLRWRKQYNISDTIMHGHYSVHPVIRFVIETTAADSANNFWRAPSADQQALAFS